VTQHGGTRWFKGNTHTHTTQSDGDTSPREVIRWYAAHGYDFLALSDHNVPSEPAGVKKPNGADFLLISGEEVSVNFNGVPIHLNALDIGAALPPLCEETIAATLRANLEAIEQAGGLGHVNHPNFRYAISAADMLPVENLRFLEVYNGHPTVYNDGDAELGKQSVESMWDDLLSSGRKVYGLAVDDAHHFAEFHPGNANPGRGWIMVRAASLTARDIIGAIRSGEFYATTGVELADLTNSASVIRLRVQSPANTPCAIEFVGPGGHVLHALSGVEAEFRPSPGQGYVRARVRTGSGARCWTQPVFP
jgi:predicted metal-dependent phosphoesterase TrpH